jgi:hypothetical protein
MIFQGIGIVTTGTVAIARIDVLQVHAAELYVAPAIGEFFDCKCWREQAESFSSVRGDVELCSRHAGENPIGDGARNSRNSSKLAQAKPENVRGELFRGHGASDLPAPSANSRPGGQPTSCEEERTWLPHSESCFRGPLNGARPSISAIAYSAGVEAGNRVELRRRGSSRGNGH